MKLLRDLLYKVQLNNVIGPTNMAIESLSFDSRKTMKFGLFVAIRGGEFDGHQFIDKAVEKGAVAVVCEDIPENRNPKITYASVANSRAALGEIASNYFDHPTEKLKIIGITGTNGKTSIATLLYQLFRNLGHKSGLISTIINKINDLDVDTKYTTPDPIMLHSLFSQMVNNGCKYCFMEVSSHALTQYRVEGVRFTGGVFTNLSHDHLDYHKGFKEYLLAKKTFFDGLGKEAFALINDDDQNGEKMVTQTDAKVFTYALKTEADFKAKIMEFRLDGMTLNMDGEEVWVKLIGQFNVYNLLAVYAVARILGFEKMDVLKVLSNLNPVEGRFQFIRSNNNISGIVDYAHTPDALQKVLETISDLRTGNEKVITVVGCGGNRDREKRPLMAEIACNASDKIILTSDNPRNEDPETIIEDMTKGIPANKTSSVLKIADRREAIRTAIALAGEGDIILVAGKGHEKYQEVKGVRHAFDDMKILKEILK